MSSESCEVVKEMVRGCWASHSPMGSRDQQTCEVVAFCSDHYARCLQETGIQATVAQTLAQTTCEAMVRARDRNDA
jgi:hypothetical protein